MVILKEYSITFHVRIMLLAAGIASLAVATIASIAPQVPSHLLPPLVTPSGPGNVAKVLTPLPDPGGPMTLERLNRLTLSGVLDGIIRRQLQQATSLDLGVPPVMGGASGHSQRSVASLATATTGPKVTNDTLQDVEPTVVAVNRGGTMNTVTVATKYVAIQGLNGLNPRNHVSTTTDFMSYTGPTELPVPAGYTMSGDPLLSVNPYLNGVAGKRVYCVGILVNQGGAAAPSAIGIWHWDGTGWSAPTIVASQAGGGFLVDKPAVAVSWQQTATLGWVYVSWTNIDTNNPAGSSIWVARSTDGGLNFTAGTVITYADAQFSQIAVDPANGNVDVMWVNITNNDIRFAQSTTRGDTFGPHEVAASGNLRTRLNQFILNGGVRAFSVPMARFNWVVNRLMIVWHGTGPNGTDIFYTYRPCASDCNFWGWRNRVQLNDNSTNDQFMPSIDFNSAGNVVVGFYDRRNDPGNILYDQFFAFVSPDGVAIQSNLRVSTFMSDPRFHNVNTGLANFIGDYQDMWDDSYLDGESATNSWIGIQNSTIIGDIFFSRIFY